ncbi:Fungalysin metallopeptidase-domain-containing protein [Globomyces pollinis-pini]|nr:Fungalysin metallopeptidase-domain-containing protein [Globomyces pollinis-pini]
MLKYVKDVKVKVSSAYQSDHNRVHHVYLEQLYNDLPVANGVGSAHMDSNGNLLYISHSFYQRTDHFLTFQDTVNILPTDPTLTAIEALESFANYLGLPIDHIGESFRTNYLVLNKLPEIPATLKMLHTETGLVLVWDFVVDLDKNWFNVQVDAHSGKVLALMDWVSHATFNVFPFGQNDPSDGPRQLLKNPENEIASPIGWNTQLSAKKVPKVYKTTIGNNVYAQENPTGGNSWKTNKRPKVKDDLVFDFDLDLEQNAETYADAAVTNLFYWNNIIHDLFYLYGFNEVAGNFQDNNFKKGGKGGDAVIANAQDGSGTNNANFATPPDGYQPRMRMYVWTQTDPDRDGDLESGIVLHEYAHGISTRLTGGPANSNCLGWGEAGGMGEGWGDFFATIVRTNSNTTRDQDYAMGDYANGGKGIRNYKYSTNKKTNPSTYGYIRKPQYWGVHAKGEVWAEILYEYFWNLVDKHGYEGDWFNAPVETRENGKAPTPVAGNKLALRLVVDGLKLQPCSPSFVDARDAIVLADKVYTNGENLCEIYDAFASRGLGIKAVAGGREDFTLPAECVGKKIIKKHQR